MNTPYSKYLVQKLKKAIPEVCKDNSEFKDAMLSAVDTYASSGDYKRLQLLLGLRDYPVDIETFLFSSDYLNRPPQEVYPAVLAELKKLNNAKGQRLYNPYVEAVLTGGIGCLSADTEFLTPTGWVTMDAYQEGMYVAEYSSDTGAVTFRPPQEYVVQPCGWFYHLKTKYGIDQALSPEHRVLFRQPKSGRLEVRSAQEVVGAHQGSAKGFHGRFLTTFKVEGRTLPDALLRVQVMVCADGTLRNEQTGQCYLNLKKPRKIERARKLLTEANIEFIEFAPNAHGYTRFGFKAPVPTKKLSSFGWSLGSASLQLIAQECLHWDGHKNTFVTTLKEEADFMSYAGSAAGYRTVQDYDARSLAPTWVVRFNPNTEVSLQGAPKTPIQKIAAEDGKKYCFTTSTGYFVARRNGRVFITGNSAKTTTALYTTAYQLYVMSCFTDPHRSFGMDSTSEITFIFQSSHGSLAQSVDYGRFREICEQSRVFTHTFPFVKHIRSELRFPSRIQVKPIDSDTGSIGQNVIGGVIDELNFMANIQNSKRSIDGGVYNQALVIYNSIARRRMSRFMSGNHMPGILCLVSSKRYPGEFTDIKLAEAKKNPNIFVYDKRVWDVKPKGTYGDARFRVFHGDMLRKARVLDASEKSEDFPAHLITEVPEEFRPTFDDDLIGAMRDIAGISTIARYPFIQNVEKISKAFSKVQGVLSHQTTNFVSPKLDFFPSRITNSSQPRWAHIDLGLTGDAAGLAIGHVRGFVKTQSQPDLHMGEAKGAEVMPHIVIDCLLRIVAPPNDEIQFYKVRDLLYLLRDNGMNIKWVTFDSYQSVDSIQLLRQRGFITGKTSMDTSDDPYHYVRGALYDGRLDMPTHDHCLTELRSLEKDMKTGKIDHPPNGTKDVSDALAGVVWGLTNRREIWNAFQIPINSRPVLKSNTIDTPLEDIR